MIGGGVFGCFAAVVLAELGHSVVIIEQESELMKRASFNNQARLHTGLHYPRSLLTAQESITGYHKFRKRYGKAVSDFTQIYAISRQNSTTQAPDFGSFINRLGVSVEEVDVDKWFNSGSISQAFRVDEPTFDSAILRKMLLEEIANYQDISFVFNNAVVGGGVSSKDLHLELANGERIYAQGVVIAAYSGTNAIREALELKPLPIRFELSELIVGRVEQEIQNFGFTVMDGPFWSLMPFGKSNKVTLTNVGLTPIATTIGQPSFRCQKRRNDCRPIHLQDCNQCPVRPPSTVSHQIQHMSRHFKYSHLFEPLSSLYTVKAILQSANIDDARPTMIYHELDMNVTTVLSGKVSTLFDLIGTLH